MNYAFNQENSAVVVCVAPNGAKKTYNDHPAIPLTPDEMASEAVACVNTGASVLHLHVRGDQLEHSLDINRYRAAIKAIKAQTKNTLLVQVTTESVGRYDALQQSNLIKDLKPAAASIALKELAPKDSDIANLNELCEFSRTHEIGLQFIVYSAQEAERLVGLTRNGDLACDKPNTLFVLGRYHEHQQSNPRQLLPFLANWPENWPWSVCAFGHQETLCMTAGVALGGHVRVGFENNLFRPDGTRADNNADLVRNIVDLVQHTNRKVATVEQAMTVYGATRLT